MEKCPFCGSEDIYFSKKRKLFVCEDCDKAFDESLLLAEDPDKQDVRGLDLFFSYGHDKNRVLVERIKRDLEKRGHRIWMDTNEIKAGDHWRKDILDGVMRSSNVIAFLSEHSTRNPGVCLDELKIAVCVKGAHVKTVLLEPENRIKQPATLSDIQWLDMSEWSAVKQISSEAFESWYQGKLAELCQSIESDDSFELNGDIHILKEKLSPYLNTEKEYLLLSKEFYGRKWLEDYIEQWQDRENSKTLVIYGKPGSGKSAFGVNYSHYHSDVYGCFLCEWNREFSIQPNQLIRTMAFRLATKLPDYRKLLLHQLGQIEGNLSEMSDDALFEALLSYPLNHLVDGGRETGIIIVDGLDEAETGGENPLAKVFARSVERLPRWIKFIFTSRPERNIVSLFSGAASQDLVSDMPEGYNDIMAYLLGTLSVELRQISNRLELLKKICELSEGVFLYAELLAEDVKNGAVDLKNPDSFPRGLSDFYRVCLERKFTEREDFERIRGFVEVLTVSDSIPETILIKACQYSNYTYFSTLDRLGSWVVRQGEEVITVGFSHKSVADWFTDEKKSGSYYTDKRQGALTLADYCAAVIEQSELNASMERNRRPEGCGEFPDSETVKYAKAHIGGFYILAEKYSELEEFLIAHKNVLNPYWKVWNQFPEDWNHKRLSDAFWQSERRNQFVGELQREGNTVLLQWIFGTLKEYYEIGTFDSELISVYIDIVHMSGNYPGAVEIADQYLNGQTMKESENNEFLSMLRVRKIHHSMFYRPTGRLLDEAMSLYAQMDDRFPAVTNELLFLIGGNLGVLYGDWTFAYEWLMKSENYAVAHSLEDYSKRNARKLADYYCQSGNYEKAKAMVFSKIPDVDKITGRYENYLVGAMGNIYTCMGYFDEALECYENVLRFSTLKGIIGWAAHANLGIANINYKLGNLKEAVEFAARADTMYRQIKQEWGIIMAGALLGACQSRMGIAPIRVACEESLRLAEKMQYGSCVSAISELCDTHNDYLKLYFL